MAKLSDLIVKLGIDASTYTEGLSKATADLNTFAGSISDRMKTAGEGLKSFGRELQSIGGSLTVGVSAPILAALGSTTKMAGDFEIAMRRVTSLLGDVTQPEFRRLSDQTLELSKSLGIDAVGAANGLYEAISAGVPKENAVSFLAVASEAAIAGVTNTKVAVDGLTNIMNAFGISMDQTRTVADAMFQAVNIGKFTFEELAGSVGTAAGTAAQLGVDFREMLAAAATITKQGFDVTEAFTQIQRAMISIISPNKEMNKLLEETGFSTGQALLNARGFEGALIAIREAAGGNVQVLTDAYGRVEGLKASLALTGDQAKMAAADLDVLRNSAGASADAFKQIDQSLPRQWERLTNEVKGLAIEFGNALLPTAKSLLETLRDLNQNVLAPTLHAFTALPQPVKDVAVSIGLAVAAIGPLIVAAGTVIWSLGQMKIAFAAIQALQLAPMFANIAFALSNNLVGSLTTAETVLLRFGQAGLIAGAAFAGWKLGEWLQSFTTEYKAAEKHLQGLHDQLKAQGVVVERGNRSLEDWAKALVAARDQLIKSKKSTEEAAKAQKEYQEKLKKAAKQTAEMAERQAALAKNAEELKKETERLNKVNKEAADRLAAQRTELVKVHLEVQKAADAMNLWRLGIMEVNGELVNFQDQAEAMVDRISAIERASLDLSKATGSMTDAMVKSMGKVPGSVDEIGKAFERQKITSTTELKKLADQATADYKRIKDSGIATANEVLQAELSALKATIEAQKASGVEATDAQKKRLGELEKILGEHAEKQKTIWDGLKNQVSTIFTDMSKGIADVIFEGKGIAEMFKGVFEEAGKAVLRFTIEFVEGKLFKALGKLLDEILPAISGKISDVFSSASTGGGGGGIPSGGGGGPAPSETEGGGGLPGGGGGGGMQDPLAWVNVAANVVSAIYGIRREGTLNAIEENTRFGMIHTLGLLLQANAYWPVNLMVFDALKTIVDNHIWRIHDIHDRLIEIRNLIWNGTNIALEAIKESVAVLPQAFAAGAAGGGSININLVMNERVLSEVVIDRMGRELNQSGQILR